MEIEKFTYFYPEKPGLLFVEQALIGIMAANPDWIAEPKYNGSRLQLHRLPSGAWELWNRHGERFKNLPSPELKAALARLNGVLEIGKYYLFDSEYRDRKTRGIRGMIVIYDIFIFGNVLLTGVPFLTRRNILETLKKAGGIGENGLADQGTTDDPLTLSPQFPDHFREVFYELIQDPEIEGLVMKNLNGVLNLGRKAGINSNWMMKIRRPSNSYKF